MPDITPDPSGLPWIVTVVLGLLGGGGAWGWLSDRAKLKEVRRTARAAEPADLATAYATFAKTLNDQAEAFIEALQAERAGLVKQVTELRREIDRLSREHEECLGDNRQQAQRIDSLERLLKLAPSSTVTFQEGGVAVAEPEPKP
jgi:uncharacterized protein HemX